MCAKSTLHKLNAAVFFVLTHPVRVHLFFRLHLPNQAPSYFHWAENKPVTTNQIYGFWQHDFPNQPHPERPPHFFRDKRPFDVCGFPYPSSGKHEWDLTASHCRSPPLSQWRPTRRFCLAVSVFHTVQWHRRNFTEQESGSPLSGVEDKPLLQ